MSRTRKQDQDGLYQRPDSIYWWASYINASGKRTRRSTGTVNQREAEELLAKWKVEAREQKHWGAKPERSFEELMLLYLRASEGHKRSANKDKQRTKKLLVYFAGRNVYSWSIVDRREYINLRLEMGVSGATINRELSLLSAAIKFANQEHDWDIVNIGVGGRQRESKGRIRWITHDEAERLLEAAKMEPKAPHLHDFILLGLHTGMRTHEMLYDMVNGVEVGLEWGKVDLLANLVYLESDHQKNGKVGSVPLNKLARQAILSRKLFRERHCPGARYVFCDWSGKPIRYVRRSFLTACKRADIENFSPHDLRHTCASWLVQSGVPLVNIKELMRHADIRTTMRYAHLAPEHSREAVHALERYESRSSHVEKAANKLSLVCGLQVSEIYK